MLLPLIIYILTDLISAKPTTLTAVRIAIDLGLFQLLTVDMGGDGTTAARLASQLSVDPKFIGMKVQL